MSHKKNKSKPRRKSRRISKMLPVAIAIALSIAVFTWVLPALNDSGSPSLQQTALMTGTLQATQTFHDFGRISMKNGKVSHLFRVKNNSSSPARIEKLYTS